MKKLISIVIPAYNEADNIPELAKQLGTAMNKLPAYNFEVIIVENGSYDDTMKTLVAAHKKDPRIKVVQLVKNEGCDGGIVAGLHYATGDAVIIMMADLQDPPAMIGQMIKKWQEGYAIVYTIVKKRVGVPATRKIGTFFFYKVMNYLTHNLLPESASDFRLLDKSVYQAVINMPEHNKYFRGLTIWTGYKTAGIPFERPPRFAGESKANLRTVIKVASDGIMAFSELPTRIAWAIPILAGLACLILLIFQQWMAALFMIFLAMIGFVVAIQGEYILRIVTESRNRPQFLTKELVGLKGAA